MIGLAGYTRADNFGDSLMFAIYAKYLQEINEEFIVVGASPIFIRRLEECGIKVDALDVNLIAEKLDKCVFIGGGYFAWPEMTSPMWQIKYIKNNIYEQIAKTCSANGIPYYIEGVEVGPGLFPFASKIIGSILDKAESIVVRNIASKESAAKITDNNVQVLPDVVLGNIKHLYSLKQKTSDKNVISENVRLGIHLSGKFTGSNYFSKQYRKLLLNFVNDNAIHHVVIFADNHLSNEAINIATEFVELLKLSHINVRLKEYTGIIATLNIIEGLDFIITNKLHCGVSALSMNRYTVAIGSSPKLPRFYETTNLEKHYLNYFLSTSKQKLSFLNSHLSNFYSSPNLNLIGTNTISESENYMVNINNISSQ